MTSKLTKQEIENAFEDLKQASLALLDIDDKVERVELERQKVRKRLSMARDVVYGLRIN